ncbi:MAG TPA: ABC transporter ATP-binding protein [Anaerolineae bacterium]|nr:ABC transporter ATP-binding protein [Anaerolineae bacterium]
MLEVQSLESGYGEVQILWGVSLQLHASQFTSLVGTNGSGKTTLLRAMTGLLPAWKGKVLLEGRDITKLSPHEKTQLGMVMVPEGRQLFTDMSVLENLQMGATPAHARSSYQRNLEWVFDLFPRLKERARQITGTLSGGEQQMVAIARGLMSHPKILMFDELSLGLSPLLVLNLFEVILKLKEQGYTILLVEQNVQMALAVSDYAYVMNNGKIEIEGKAKEVREMPSVRKAYLGV